MPIVRKLAPDEVQTIENKGKGIRKLIQEQYDGFLADCAAGDYGEAQLEADENRLTVSSRLKAAAARRHLRIQFRRTRGNLLRFMIVSTDDQGNTPKAAASKPKSLLPPPAKRKGGRPKKTSA